LEYRPSKNDSISCLVSLATETYELVNEEFKSCSIAILHIDLVLNENVEDSNVSDGLHMSRYLFTMGDIDQIIFFWKKPMYPPTTPFPLTFLVTKNRPFVL